MATNETTTGHRLHQTPTGAIASQDKERRSIALSAAGGIEALLRMLDRERDAEPDSQAFEKVLGFTLRRLAELNGVVVSALSDDRNRATTEMANVVFGEGVSQ